MRILVVDDEPAVRDSLERALRLDGYEVELARDGGEGLAKLRAAAPDPSGGDAGDIELSLTWRGYPQGFRRLR